MTRSHPGDREHGDSVARAFARARRETPPTVDVVNSVMMRLRSEREPAPASVTPLGWIAGISAAVAAPAVAVLAFVWVVFSDPLGELFTSMFWGML